MTKQWIRSNAAQVRLDGMLLAELGQIRGLSPIASDVLDTLGWNTTVPGGVITARSGPYQPSVVGHAVTMAYLPEQSMAHAPGRFPRKSGLAHEQAFSYATPSDVLVIDARGMLNVSVMGGNAALQAVKTGLGGVVVDGAVRDIEDIREAGLNLWSRSLTPSTGKLRIEAALINYPVACCGVTVFPGDLVIADLSGICVVPNAVIHEAVAGILALARKEERAGLK